MFPIEPKGDKDEKVVVIDVDGTLIIESEDEFQSSNVIRIIDPYDGKIKFFIPHKKHIELLKHFYNRGYYTIVWSAAGGRWARIVVAALELNDFVCDTLAKPIKYIDDLPAHEWMGNRIYMDQEDGKE